MGLGAAVIVAETVDPDLAIADADPAATVAADLEHRRITVTGGSLDAEALRAIIADAGYPATAT